MSLQSGCGWMAPNCVAREAAPEVRARSQRQIQARGPAAASNAAFGRLCFGSAEEEKGRKQKHTVLLRCRILFMFAAILSMFSQKFLLGVKDTHRLAKVGEQDKLPLSERRLNLGERRPSRWEKVILS